MSSKVSYARDNLRVDAIVVHSGGMDSSLCLAVAAKRFGPEHVLSMSFRYGQRHAAELDRARIIAARFGVRNIVVPIDCMEMITASALMDTDSDIFCDGSGIPNTLVTGRNGLMTRIAAIHAQHLGAGRIFLGVIEVESSNSGYPDCTRAYMDKMQEILRLDLMDPDFEVETPVVHMTKKQTMVLGHELGVLEYLLDTTITCYRGIDKVGCMDCPACNLRNDGIIKFLQDCPEFEFSYKQQLLLGAS